LLPETFAVIYAESDATGKSTAKNLPMPELDSLDQLFAFEDYSESELLMILHDILKRDNMTMDREATQTMAQYIAALCAAKHLNRASARTMKTLAKTIAGNAHLRAIAAGARPLPEGEAPQATIIGEDVASFVWNENGNSYRRMRPIGFKSCA